MSNKPPPVPPANRSPMGSESSGRKESDVKATEHRPAPENLAQEDRQGNIKQNTTHQGHQQDR